VLARVVEASLRYKYLVMVAALLVVALGVRALTRIPIDAFPDVTPVQVQIFTESPGLSPEEVEKIITVPVESAMAGLPKVELIRSLSMFGLSFVTVFFEDGTDVFFARQLIFERLGEARERIPAGFGAPLMGPNTTGLGQVFQYYLKAQDRQLSLMDLRALQDWSVRLLLRTAPGVDDVLSFGGDERQYQVLIEPARLVKYGLSLSDVLPRVAAGNKAVGGQFLVRNREEYLVRGSGWAQSVDDLQRIVLKEEKGTPVLLRDVAQVVQGPAPRRGAVTRNGEEVVTGIALKRGGENTKQVIENVKAKLAVAQKALPKGVTLEPAYDQTELVQKAVGTAERALLEGGVLVVIVLFLFLGEVRSALVVVSAVPLSMLIAFLLMELTGVSANHVAGRPRGGHRDDGRRRRRDGRERLSRSLAPPRGTRGPRCGGPRRRPRSRESRRLRDSHHPRGVPPALRADGHRGQALPADGHGGHLRHGGLPGPLADRGPGAFEPAPQEPGRPRRACLPRAEAGLRPRAGPRAPGPAPRACPGRPAAGRQPRRLSAPGNRVRPDPRGGLDPVPHHEHPECFSRREPHGRQARGAAAAQDPRDRVRGLPDRSRRAGRRGGRQQHRSLRRAEAAHRVAPRAQQARPRRGDARQARGGGPRRRSSASVNASRCGWTS
jgi:hypothetical protein